MAFPEFLDALVSDTFRLTLCRCLWTLTERPCTVGFHIFSDRVANSFQISMFPKYINPPWLRGPIRIFWASRVYYSNIKLCWYSAYGAGTPLTCVFWSLRVLHVNWWTSKHISALECRIVFFSKAGAAHKLHPPRIKGGRTPQIFNCKYKHPKGHSVPPVGDVFPPQRILSFSCF